MNGNTNGNGLIAEADAAPTASGEGNIHGTDDKNEALSREEQQSELDTLAAFYVCPVVSLSHVRRTSVGLTSRKPRCQCFGPP